MGFFGADTSPITVIDLGSHQTRALIASLYSDGGTELLGFGQRKTVGVSEGLIIDPRWAEQSVSDVVASAENLANLKVTKAYVALSNKMIRSVTVTLEQALRGEVISAGLCAELRRAAEEQAAARLADTVQWAHLHIIPLGYSVDGSEPTDHPDGLYGSTLRAQFHVVSVPMMTVNNLRQCFALNGIEVERFILAPYAAALGTLDRAGQQYGATVVDLGGDTTSLAAFGRFKLMQTAVLPFGGNDVTRDIATHFGFNEERAEKLKVTEGNLAASLTPSPSHRAIDHAATLFNAKAFEHADLNPIVEARVREILLAVQETLASPGFQRNGAHTLLLTGAGSQLKGLLAYAEHMFHDKRVRLAVPSGLPGAPEVVMGAGFATVSGLLDYAVKCRLQQMGASGLLDRARRAPQRLVGVPLVQRLFGG